MHTETDNRSIFREFGFTWVDRVLLGLTAPITLFVLMSATSGLVPVLQNTRQRRIFLTICLLAEIALIALFIWMITAF